MPSKKCKIWELVLTFENKLVGILVQPPPLFLDKGGSKVGEMYIFYLYFAFLEPSFSKDVQDRFPNFSGFHFNVRLRERKFLIRNHYSIFKLTGWISQNNPVTTVSHGRLNNKLLKL